MKLTHPRSRQVIEPAADQYQTYLAAGWQLLEEKSSGSGQEETEADVSAAADPTKEED